MPVRANSLRVEMTLRVYPRRAKVPILSATKTCNVNFTRTQTFVSLVEQCRRVFDKWAFRLGGK